MNTGDSQAEEAYIDSSTQSKWQRLLDLTIEVIGVPLALITRTNSAESEILLCSGVANKGFSVGDTFPNHTGMYFEAVAESKSALAIEDASRDERWKKTKSLELGLIAYLGFPILLPSGEVFGTICAMDTKARHFSELNRILLGEFANIIAGDLRNQLLQNDQLLVQAKFESAELELKEEREKFKQAFETSTSGILITSLADGVILDANFTYQRLFGYSYEELVGRSATELNIYVHQSDRDYVISKLRNGESVRDYEMTLRTKNGESRVVQGTVLPIKLGEKNCLITSIYDITSLRKLEFESILLNERYMLATRAAQAGIWDWDIVNNVLAWDNQMYRLYDATKEEFGGAYEAWLARIHPDDLERADADSRMAQTGEKDYNTEFRIHTADGSIRYIKAYNEMVAGGGSILHGAVVQSRGKGLNCGKFVFES